MPDPIVPVRFELSINGGHVATGGVAHGVTIIIISRRSRLPDLREAPDNPEWFGENLEARFGGMASGKEGKDFDWAKFAFQVGDTLTVRILGPGISDAPMENAPKSPCANPTKSESAREWHGRPEELYHALLDELIANVSASHSDYVAICSALARTAVLGHGVPKMITLFDSCHARRRLGSLLLDTCEGPDQGSLRQVPVRFQVVINGQVRATGGVKHSMTSLSITRISRDADGISPDQERQADFDRDEWLQEKIKLRFGGLLNTNDSPAHVDWIKDAPLQGGDEIAVRILGPGPSDAPLDPKSRFADESSIPIDHETDLAVRRSYDVFVEAFDAVISNIVASDAAYLPHRKRMTAASKDYLARIENAMRHAGPNQKDYEIRSYGLQDGLPAVIALLDEHRAWKLARRKADTDTLK